jgi:hypothetical protein
MLAVTLVGCSDRSPAVDAELARDLQLASAQPAQAAQPQLTDAPLDAPAPRPQELRAPAPVRTREPARAPSRAPVRPAVSTPLPAPQSLDPAPASAETPEPAPAQQSAPTRTRGILAGTSFGLSTHSEVCTSNLPGDKIVATVTGAVVGENGAVIPAGSTVVLEVASVTPGDSPESAQIALRVRSVVLDGEAHPVDGSVAIASELERRRRQRESTMRACRRARRSASPRTSP